MSVKYSEDSVWAIVPAAGSGSRMGQPSPKQYLPLQQKLVIEHTLEALLELDSIEGIVVVLSEIDQRFKTLAIANHPKIMTAIGGRERSDSVLAGLNFLQKKAKLSDWVLVHDAARCCIRPEAIENLLKIIRDDDVGGILGVPASDTLKQVSQDRIDNTIDRSQVWQAQTPQVFRFGILRDALQNATQKQLPITDEASAIELAGLQPKIVMGHYDNIKITHPEDLVLANAILQQENNR